MQPLTFLLVGIITSATLVQFLAVAEPVLGERSSSATIRDVRQKALALASALQLTEGFEFRSMGFEANNPILPKIDSIAQARPDVMTSQTHQLAMQTNQQHIPTKTKTARKVNVRLSLQILALDQWQATAPEDSPDQ